MDVREKLVELLGKAKHEFWRSREKYNGTEFVAGYLVAHGVTVIPPEGIGEMSDGYHTFNELYHHRAVLFSVICNAMPDKAWKSKRHDTGDMYDGMFIVGIETNHGQATYHYDVDPYWDMFNVPELEYAPKWDGHTPQEAINRIAHGVTVQEWISVSERLPQNFVSVLGYMTDAGEFPPVRECYTVGNEFFFPALGDVHPVSHWCEMPQPPKGE